MRGHGVVGQCGPRYGGKVRGVCRLMGEAMFQNAVIDVAIGLVLMYLMLSLLCTVINEFIATKLKLRANSLASALGKLLDNDTLRDAFYKHGLIAGTRHATVTGTQSTASAIANVARAAADGVKKAAAGAKKMVGIAAPAAAPTPAAPGGPLAAPAAKQDHPSYLSGNTVALALIGCLNGGNPLPGVADVEAAVKGLPPSNIRDALLSSLTGAQQDLEKLRTSIATWFDDSMERLSGAYKRQLKWISMLIGLIVAIGFNADSFAVATSLWSDPARRATVVEVALKVAKEPPPAAGQPVDEDKLQKAIENTEKTLRPLPIGWQWQCETKQTAAAPNAFQSMATWMTCFKTNNPRVTSLQVLGWLLTAAALSLGAPFWFDLLNKFMNLRGAGSKPQREDAKPQR